MLVLVRVSFDLFFCVLVLFYLGEGRVRDGGGGRTGGKGCGAEGCGASMDGRIDGGFGWDREYRLIPCIVLGQVQRLRCNIKDREAGKCCTNVWGGKWGEHFRLLGSQGRNCMAR